MFSRLSLILFVMTAALWGQSNRATITGFVTDPSGAAVPGAAVTATNQATAVRYAAKSSGSGVYSILQLPEGKYELRVEGKGFRAYVHRDIELDIAQTRELSVTLEVGAVSQTIEVTGSGAALDTASATVGTVVSQERILDLPLSVSGNMRNPESFIFLAPGVSGSMDNTQINGSLSRAKDVLFDGASSTTAESGGSLMTAPSVESIGEFKLVTSAFKPEYGRTGAGFEVFATKSGTNQLHGAVFDYLRNNTFDARGFFAPSTPVNRQNEYGTSLGGPMWIPKVYKGINKTFFYFVYSGFQFNQGASRSLVSIPPPDFRQGNFTRLVDRNNKQVVVYDPGTTRGSGSSAARDPFPGNIIPQNRISAVSRNILPLLPDVTNNSILNNFLTTGQADFTRGQESVKIDHSFSERHRLSGYFYYSGQRNHPASQLPVALSAGYNNDRRSRWLRLTDDYVLSPRTLNTFFAGITRDGLFWSRLSANQDWPQKIGLQGVLTGPGNTFPAITFTDGWTNWGNENKNVGSQVSNTFQVSDSISHVTGSHTLKFGIETRRLQTNGADPAMSQGRFSFSNSLTAFPTAAGRSSSGNAFASFLLGEVDNGTRTVFLVEPGLRYHYVAGYAQDEWKPGRKLTVTYGLRYDLFFPRRERFNNMSGFDPTLPNPAAGGSLGAIAFLGTGPGRNGRNSFVRGE